MTRDQGVGYDLDGGYDSQVWWFSGEYPSKLVDVGPMCWSQEGRNWPGSVRCWSISGHVGRHGPSLVEICRLRAKVVEFGHRLGPTSVEFRGKLADEVRICLDAGQKSPESGRFLPGCREIEPNSEPELARFEQNYAYAPRMCVALVPKRIFGNIALDYHYQHCSYSRADHYTLCDYHNSSG